MCVSIGLPWVPLPQSREWRWDRRRHRSADAGLPVPPGGGTNTGSGCTQRVESIKNMRQNFTNELGRITVSIIY